MARRSSPARVTNEYLRLRLGLVASLADRESGYKIDTLNLSVDPPGVSSIFWRRLRGDSAESAVHFCERALSDAEVYHDLLESADYVLEAQNLRSAVSSFARGIRLGLMVTYASNERAVLQLGLVSERAESLGRSSTQQLIEQ